MKAKGVGELGICGVAAAVGKAVYNATGIRVRDYPITLDKFIDRLPMAGPAYFRHVQALPDCRYRQANLRPRQAGPRRQATRALPGHRLIVKYLPSLHAQKAPAPSAHPHCPWRRQAAQIQMGNEACGESVCRKV